MDGEGRTDVLAINPIGEIVVATQVQAVTVGIIQVEALILVAGQRSAVLHKPQLTGAASLHGGIGVAAGVAIT